MKTQKSCTCFARKATKPLPCLHFTFIQQALFRDGDDPKSCLKSIGEWELVNPALGHFFWAYCCDSS